MISIDHILPLVRKPGRYVGNELHAAAKDRDEAKARFALVFPDLYEIGMSHQGLQILYHILNSREEFSAERSYCPDTDMEGELRRHDIPLFTLESRRPVSSFDVVGITLPYELCYTNILTVLDLAGIPFRANQRSEAFPLIIGGGSCGLNPEPVAEFFDAIVLGDGEEVILDIAELVMEAKRSGASRREILDGMTDISGVYVPSFFEPVYSGTDLTAILPLKPGYTDVRRRVIPGLPGPDALGSPLVPIVKPVHDRLGLEIARGCTRGCRFCQAGMIYRPVRERTVDEIMTIAEQGVKSSGFDEMALLSLSSGDFSCLPELMVRLMNRFADQYVSVSMPSMRVGTLTSEIMSQIRRVRKTGFTVAPEAGTDRLREVINKGITEQDLLETCRSAFAMGWNLIKFYFMIGLPTETIQDVEAIVGLAQKARRTAGPDGRRVQINVSVGTFVPKPHTPFQWERQLSLEESRERINLLKKLLPRRGFKLKWQDPEQSVMEGVFARGDRRLSHLVETAWKNGVRLDGWSEHYRLEHWQQAAKTCSINLDSYLRGRDPGQVLPWDHLGCGVDREFLVQELQKALAGEYTPDCRTNGCQLCGLCDFKVIRPVVNTGTNASLPVSRSETSRKEDGEVARYTYRVHYTRLGDTRFFSHLEVLQLIFRAITRAGIPVLYSQGFNPSPRVSFSPALPVGVESEVEHFDMIITSAIDDRHIVIENLNRQLPGGMEVYAMGAPPRAEPETQVISYRVLLNTPLTSDQQEGIKRFMMQESFVIERIRKKKQRELDIRPLIKSLEGAERDLCFELFFHQGRAGVSPRDILHHVVRLHEKDVLLARVKKEGIVDFQPDP
jgi:radical SAM family uncharacterized protein/radical SAM-linked protein